MALQEYYVAKFYNDEKNHIKLIMHSYINRWSAERQAMKSTRASSYYPMVTYEVVQIARVEKRGSRRVYIIVRKKKILDVRSNSDISE